MAGAQVDVDQGQAEEGAAALVFIVPAPAPPAGGAAAAPGGVLPGLGLGEAAGVLIMVAPGIPAGVRGPARLGPGPGGLYAPDEVVQADAEVVAQGGQVVHVRPGHAALPLLDRLAGDPHDAGQLLLGDAPLLAQPVEAGGEG